MTYRGYDSSVYDREPFCNFCGKKKSKVLKLIEENSKAICNECIDLCTEILAEDMVPRYCAGFINPVLHEVAFKVALMSKIVTQTAYALPCVNEGDIRFASYILARDSLLAASDSLGSLSDELGTPAGCCDRHPLRMQYLVELVESICAHVRAASRALRKLEVDQDRASKARAGALPEQESDAEPSRADILDRFAKSFARLGKGFNHYAVVAPIASAAFAKLQSALFPRESMEELVRLMRQSANLLGLVAAAESAMLAARGDSFDRLAAVDVKVSATQLRSTSQVVLKNLTLPLSESLSVSDFMQQLRNQAIAMWHAMMASVSAIDGPGIGHHNTLVADARFTLHEFYSTCTQNNPSRERLLGLMADLESTLTDLVIVLSPEN